MLHLLVYRLELVPREDKQFDRLLAAYNKSCEFLACEAAKIHRYNYEDLRNQRRAKVCEKFGLPSELGNAACGRVCRDFAHMNEGDSRREKAVIPSYKDNGLVSYNNGSASVRVPAMRPTQISRLPIRLSLSTLAKRTLYRYRLHLMPLPADFGWLWTEGDMGLDRSPEGHWRFRVAVEATDEDLMGLPFLRPAELEEALDNLGDQGWVPNELGERRGSALGNIENGYSCEDPNAEPFVPREADEDNIPSIDDEN